MKKHKKVIGVDEEKDLELKNVSNTHLFKHTSSPIIKAKAPELK